MKITGLDNRRKDIETTAFDDRRTTGFGDRRIDIETTAFDDRS